jgi:hypothetical protein
MPKTMARSCRKERAHVQGRGVDKGDLRTEGKDGEGSVAVEVIERVAPRYEITSVELGEMELGRVYSGRPELVVLECSCGKRSTYKCVDIDFVVWVCECGRDEMVGIREELVTTPLVDEGREPDLHPWRYWHTSAETGLPC